MDFSLDDEHLALREAVQRFCDGEYPAEHRGAPETPEDQRRRWSGMAELGLLGLSIPGAFGGSGQGPVETMLVAQELGRALGGGAFVASTVVAGTLLAQLGSDAQQQQWLPALATGEMQAALALDEPGTRYDWDRAQLRASRDGDDWVLDGSKAGVPHGDTAQLLLVLARVEGAADGDAGLAVFAVDAATAGVQVRGHGTLDGRRAAQVRFEQVRVPATRLLGAVGGVRDALEAALDAGTAALCAEAAGAVEALIVHTTEHLRTRRQFGAPLAKFQVLQHRLADLVIALEQLKSMACIAAMSVQQGEPASRRRGVSAAKVLASQLGRQVGLAAIQLHGAMGMTDECRVAHYAKRLLVIGQLHGDAAWHLRRVATANAR
ncbi:acyl-CoA dehydrogenase family protein [Ramlibacter sp. AW1]|uniref:Acyl-CoA dehydrogenase family protein n=1 Tax=Ramlibacter aurantiacus TaxID=2801330 RepID=A0A937D3U3_9BURK|nr:acyl-CoA dehydrogenase [Ramlibacter aurantiacus]MBL0419692.1 acyl-CoA dehydrogenase family protein [Ramlibacter aurantiacus]